MRVRIDTLRLACALCLGIKIRLLCSVTIFATEISALDVKIICIEIRLAAPLAADEVRHKSRFGHRAKLKSRLYLFHGLDFFRNTVKAIEHEPE